MNVWEAIILGLVEGITEFLPVSSTGHMILTAHMLGLDQSEVVKSFEIAIQLGSILAVLFVFLKELRYGLSIWAKLFLGFIPTGLLGFALYSFIKDLFAPGVTAYMLIAGGIVFIVLELYLAKKGFPSETLKNNLNDITYSHAFIIGLSQSLAMIPGTSRSGATIVSGLLCGFSRTLAAKFSFLLAIPTMFAATGYDLYKNYELFSISDLKILLIGSLVAFLVALLTIRVFLSFLKRFSYISLGIYRILLGILFLWYLY